MSSDTHAIGVGCWLVCCCRVFAVPLRHRRSSVLRLLCLITYRWGDCLVQHNPHKMKKLLFTLAIAVCLLTSCGGIRYQIGESTSAFLNQNHKKNFELVRTSTEWTVYKWTNGWSYDAPYFFYFHNDALTQIDRGTTAPDLIIQTYHNWWEAY